MVLSETLSYATILAFTVIFTVFAIVIQDTFWRTALKIMGMLFWFVMAIGQFIFFSLDDPLIILSFPYAAFGLLLLFALIKDFLTVKHDRIFGFDD